MNEAAWEASKASLLQCKNCGRRFATDRLSVHMRSCKEPPGGGKFTPPPAEKSSVTSFIYSQIIFLVILIF